MTTDEQRDRKNTSRQVRGSVQEAIGKLIGDDDARSKGAAKRRVGKEDAEGTSGED